MALSFSFTPKTGYTIAGTAVGLVIGLVEPSITGRNRNWPVALGLTVGFGILGYFIGESQTPVTT